MKDDEYINLKIPKKVLAGIQLVSYDANVIATYGRPPYSTVTIDYSSLDREWAFQFFNKLNSEIDKAQRSDQDEN